MELRQYFGIARRRWWILVLGTLVAAATAFGVSKRLTPIYQAQATLLLNLATQPSTPTLQDISASQALTKTYARLITSRPTLEEAARRLGDGVTAATISKISGEDVPQTELLHVSLQDRDPVFAAKVVNAVSEVFAQRVKESQLGDAAAQGGAADAALTPKNSIFIAEPAVAPAHPVSPRVGIDTALAAVAGLVAAVGIVALLEYLDDTVKSPDDLGALGVTLMGTVQRHVPEKGSHLTVLALEAAHSSLAEGYRQLRTNIEFAALDGEVRSLVVTSAQSGEGKTTTACNLAIMLAKAGKRVIIVDADLRQPTVHAFFHLGNHAGLTNAFFAPASFEELLLQETPVANLRVITTGPLPPNPAELLGSKRMVALMDRLVTLADVVVYDTPPGIAVADAAVVAAHADAILLVVDAGHTRLNAVRTVLDHLGRSRTRLLGVVLNKVRGRRGGYNYYYEYYSSRES
ncbi:MAG: tyrosine-protein kinase domain-containing protein [Dehalococcoidia bacterium]